MDYAGVLGQNFEIPLQQSVMPINPQLAELQAVQNANIQGPKLEDGLAEVEGLTKEYYDKWAALNQYSEGMQSMGINVTKPDPLNPQSQAAHRWYLKAVADLQRHGSSLKNQQKILDEFVKNKFSAHGQNIGFGQLDPNRGLVNAMDIQNTAETDMVKRINSDLAKSTNDPNERKQLQGQIESKKALLRNELAQMLQEGAPESAIQAKANELNQIQDATYNDTDRWKERMQDARAKKKEEDPIPDERFNLVQRIKNGEHALLTANANIASAVPVNTPRKQGVTITYKDGTKEFIDYADEQNIDFAINRVLDKGQESKAVGIDRYSLTQKERVNDLVQPHTEDAAPAEKYFIDALTNEEEGYKSRTEAQQRLREVASKLVIPASISGQPVDAYVRSFGFSGSRITINLADENGKQTGEMMLDLTKQGDIEKFKMLIDENGDVIDYKSFAPHADQDRLRVKNTMNPTQGYSTGLGTNVVDSNDIPDFL
jgi:hypothetical protein